MLDRLASVAWWLERRPRTRRALMGLLLVPAVCQLATLVWVIAGRLSFPLQLEWLEGGEIYHAVRLLHGDAIYRRAASGFLPYPYPPLHAAMVAAVGAVGGLSYAAARAVSVACFAAAASVLTWRTMVHWPRRTRSVVALVSFGYLAATYPMVSGWYDIARPDSTALVFAVLAAATLDRQGERVRVTHMVTAGALATLALYAKQTNVFPVAWLCLFAFLHEGKRAWVLIATLGVACIGAFAWLEWQTSGAFAEWVFATRHHALRPSALAKYVGLLMVHAPFLLFVPFAARRLAARGELGQSSRLWLGMVLAAIPASALPYVKVGGGNNNLIPILFLAGPVTLMVVGDAFAASTLAGRGRAELSSASPVARLVWVGLLVQALIASVYLYDPRRVRPSAEAHRQAEALNRTIAALEGGVICPLDPFLPAVNGDSTEQAHWISHRDAMRGQRPGVTAASYTSWLTHERPRWILLAGVPEESPIPRAIDEHYALVRELPAPSWQPRWLKHPPLRKLYERCDGDGAEARGHGPCSKGSGPIAE